MKQKPGVMIYFDLIPVLGLLSNEEKGILFQTILDYAQEGVYTPLDERLTLLWPLIQQRLDRDWERYQLTVIKRKYAAYSRWEKQRQRDPLPYAQWVAIKGYEQPLEEECDTLA